MNSIKLIEVPIEFNWYINEEGRCKASRALMLHYTGKEEWPLTKHFDQNSPHVRAEVAMHRHCHQKAVVEVYSNGDTKLRLL